jgi:hypothetical protein
MVASKSASALFLKMRNCAVAGEFTHNAFADLCGWHTIAFEVGQQQPVQQMIANCQLKRVLQRHKQVLSSHEEQQPPK